MTQSEMNIFTAIKRETASLRHKKAVIEGQTSLDYEELLAAAEQVAGALATHGVERFHRVGLLCDDSIDYIIASLAVLSLSAVVVPVAPEQTAEEIDAVVERIDLNFLLAEARLRPQGEGTPFDAAGFREKIFVIRSRTVAETPPGGYFTVNPAFIRFTSGTTGTSKGVVLSHEAILARTDAADRGLCITSGDVVLWLLSMSYHFVVTILLFLRRGATIVLCGSRYPSSLIEGITRHQGTFIYGSPFYYNFLSHSELLSGNALLKIRLAISTTMKLPDQVADDFLAKFGFELTEAYGIIEVGLPFIRGAECHGKRGSVGRALPDYELCLRNQDDQGIGEICIRGSGMLDAYFSPWQGRDAVLDDGWFNTGDLGKLDQDDYLYIVGREKEVINFVGMKVFPQEVEAILNVHRDVEESQVFGVPHPQYGQLPTARIVLREGISGDDVVDELRRYCYQRLAQYKVPKYFEFVTALPRTASGKLKR
jgi:long-chain acyl-CoA synthetase